MRSREPAIFTKTSSRITIRPSQILDEFVRVSGIYREKLDATVLATFAEMRPERLAKLASMEGIKDIVANYGRTHGTTARNLVTESAGRPVFRAMNRQPHPLNPVGGANLNLPVGLTLRRLASGTRWI